MKVFVKRYPEKGEFPEDGVMVYAGDGRLYYDYERKEWICSDGYTRHPLFWLEEIELPDAEDISRQALGPFKEKDLEDQYGDFIQEDINTFTKGANYILNHLKSK